MDGTMTGGRTMGQRVARVTLAVAVAAAVAFTVREFVPALVWGAVLAVGVWPAYARAEAALGGPRPGHARTVLPLAACLLVLLLLGLPLALVGIQAGHEAKDAAALWHRAATEGLPPPAALSGLPLIGGRAAAWWDTNLARPNAIVDAMGRVDRASALELGKKVGASLAHRVELLGFALVTLFVLLREARTVAAEVTAVAVGLLGPRGTRVVGQANAAVRGAVDGLVLVGIGEGVVIGVGYVVAGVPHPTLFGLLTAVAAMLPFGLIPVVAVAAALLLAKGAAGWAVTVGMLALVVSFVADHFVRPKVMGAATRLPFLWVLFGILGGVASYGLMGLFVGPTVMALGIMLWRELVAAGCETVVVAATPGAPAPRVAAE